MKLARLKALARLRRWPPRFRRIRRVGWCLLVATCFSACCWKGEDAIKAPWQSQHLIQESKAKEIALRRALAGSSEIRNTSLEWSSYWRVRYVGTHPGLSEL